jgi:hypothetical protein
LIDCAVRSASATRIGFPRDRDDQTAFREEITIAFGARSSACDLPPQL